MPKKKTDRLPITPLPKSIYLLYQEIQSEMVTIMDLCLKFDKGNESAGMRFGMRLNEISKKIQDLRAEIQRIRYYRDALLMFQGKRRWIDALKFKEKRYGKVSDVAKFQILQKCKYDPFKRR